MWVVSLMIELIIWFPIYCLHMLLTLTKHVSSYFHPWHFNKRLGWVTRGWVHHHFSCGALLQPCKSAVTDQRVVRQVNASQLEEIRICFDNAFCVCRCIYFTANIVTEHVIFTYFETTKMFLISWARPTNCSLVSVTLPYGWLVAVGFGNCLVLSSIKPLPEPVLIQIYIAIWHEYATAI